MYLGEPVFLHIGIKKETCIDHQFAMFSRSLLVLVASLLVPRHSASSDITDFVSQFLPVSGNNVCTRDTLVLIQGIKNLENWALQMMDASAKLQSGLLRGNIRNFGDYDECVSTNNGRFTGQYCLASVQLTPVLGTAHYGEASRLLNLATVGRRDIEMTHNRSSIMVPDPLPTFAHIQLGVCVPSSCSEADVQAAVTTGLHTLASPLGLSVSAVVPPNACSTSNTRYFDALDIAMLIVLGTLVILAIIGSILDKKLLDRTNLTSWNTRCLMAFSIPSNWRRLINTDPPSPGSFTSVDGLRAISALLLVIYHRIMYIPLEPLSNKYFLVESLKNMANMPWSNAPTVETFFLVSGMLRAHSTLRELEGRRFYYFKDALKRYLRLTPAMAIMMLFYATLLPHFGSGPLWHKTVDLLSDSCREVWPLNLLYINNYHSGNRFCLSQTWYLAADMQMYLLAPLLIVPMWRWPWIASPLLMGATIIAIANTFFYTIATQALGLPNIGYGDDRIIFYVSKILMKTQHRAAPYLIGLALGYWIFKLSKNKVILSKPVLWCGWMTSIALIYYVIFGPYEMVQFNYEYNVLESAAYSAFHRPAWALAIAWIVFVCHTGNGVWMNRALSSNILRPLSRLSYCIFLVHCIFILISTGRLRNAIYLDVFEIVISAGGILNLTLYSATILYLLVEAPVLELVKIAFSKNESSVTTYTNGLAVNSQNKSQNKLKSY